MFLLRAVIKPGGPLSPLQLSILLEALVHAIRQEKSIGGIFFKFSST